MHQTHDNNNKHTRQQHQLNRSQINSFMQTINLIIKWIELLHPKVPLTPFPACIPNQHGVLNTDVCCLVVVVVVVVVFCRCCCSVVNLCSLRKQQRNLFSCSRPTSFSVFSSFFVHRLKIGDHRTLAAFLSLFDVCRFVVHPQLQTSVDVC